MNIKSLIATFSILSAATSTAALADASFSVHAHGHVTIGTSIPTYVTTGPTVRDHRSVKREPMVVRYHDDQYDRDDRDESEARPARPRPLPPIPTRPPAPELTISRPRIDTAAQFSFYTGAIGEVGNARGFVAITEATRIDSGREHFDVSGAGLVNTLKIQLVAGTTELTNINVMFANGTSQMFAVNQTLDARNPTITLELAGSARQLAWINVNGTSTARSAYQILGS
ncbi:MAG: hypothetical protein NT062_23075 [Proteobacteria bacterium]|nr:hypothetical protein [Pseudomonadota bacterium]